MRTRRSRFFVILLHLVGVSHRLNRSGIVAVSPRQIVLQEVQPHEIDEPTAIWLQDPSDGSCLGPTGDFIECGDATLWLVEKKTREPNRKLFRFPQAHSVSFIFRSQSECLNKRMSVGSCRKRLFTGPQVAWSIEGSSMSIGTKCVQRDDDRRAVLGDCKSAVPITFLKYSTASPPPKPLKPRRRAETAPQSSNLPKILPSRQLHPIRAALGNTNPILLATTPARLDQSKLQRPVGAAGSIHLKQTRIKSHPYIKAAKNGAWTCPQTGLAFPTDLASYLGKDNGRHTLTGVGVYRKGYVIKVYGVAYYASKRDVLALPELSAYAGLSAEELRTRPDFYDILRHGKFDRTLVLKTNMQLSAETMRSSLQADWSYLTEEAKTTLISSSMEPRPATGAMLDVIADADNNPSKCSCAQVAPDHYGANPDCCARGTELVFTWTKQDELEVRLNGLLMDSFPRPDIAAGIFYEYLRLDDPIAPELLDRVVDGFPFLLAPLAQLRDIKTSSSSSDSANRVHLLQAVGSSLRSHMQGVSKNAQRMGSETVVNAQAWMRTVGDHWDEFGKEVERRKTTFTKNARNVAQKILNRDEEALSTIAVLLSGGEDSSDELEQQQAPVFMGFGKDYHAEDEIQPMKYRPTINKIILVLVHLYLLLLFIVSFPGNALPTKAFRKSNMAPHLTEKRPINNNISGLKKKSFSYVL